MQLSYREFCTTPKYSAAVLCFRLTQLTAQLSYVQRVLHNTEIQCSCTLFQTDAAYNGSHLATSWPSRPALSSGADCTSIFHFESFGNRSSYKAAQNHCLTTLAVIVSVQGTDHTLPLREIRWAVCPLQPYSVQLQHCPASTLCPAWTLTTLTLSF